MNKNEFLTRLNTELKKNNVADAEDIVNEYEQHFAFKTADGFTEEEIAVKLGDPLALASQFGGNESKKKNIGRKFITVTGLVFVDIVGVIFLITLIAWEAIMAVFSLVSGTIGVCLISGLNIYSLIPQMPYYCAAIFSVSFFALAVLAAVGSIYFAAFVRQLVRFYKRFHHNSIAAADGDAQLPSISINPQLSAKFNRHLRTTALFSLAVFSAFFVLGIAVAMISSNALEFWHQWGWFNYSGNN